MAQEATTMALTPKEDELVAALAWTTKDARRKLTVRKAHANRIVMMRRVDVGPVGMTRFRLLNITGILLFEKDTPFWQRVGYGGGDRNPGAGA
jgi:hypothetical protein